MFANASSNSAESQDPLTLELLKALLAQLLATSALASPPPAAQNIRDVERNAGYLSETLRPLRPASASFESEVRQHVGGDSVRSSPHVLHQPWVMPEPSAGNTSVNSSVISCWPVGVDQSCATSAISVLVAVSTTPASRMRWRENSSDRSLGEPDASITACTPKPSLAASMAGKMRHTSVVTPAMMRFFPAEIGSDDGWLKKFGRGGGKAAMGRYLKAISLS